MSEHLSKFRGRRECPPYYRTQHRVAGVEPGVEVIEYLAALLGPDAPRIYLSCELIAKAIRVSTRPETAREDLGKIQAACDALQLLLAHSATVEQPRRNVAIDDPMAGYSETVRRAKGMA